MKALFFFIHDAASIQNVMKSCNNTYIVKGLMQKQKTESCLQRRNMTAFTKIKQRRDFNI